jgi:hypothetical protein
MLRWFERFQLTLNDNIALFESCPAGQSITGMSWALA